MHALVNIHRDPKKSAVSFEKCLPPFGAFKRAVAKKRQTVDQMAAALRAYAAAHGRVVKGGG